MLDTRKSTTLAKAISAATTQHTRRDIVFPAACQIRDEVSLRLLIADDIHQRCPVDDEPRYSQTYDDFIMAEDQFLATHQQTRVRL